MIRKHFISIILAAMMFGCATYAAGPLFKEVLTPPPAKAMLYLFRGDAYFAWNPTIKIDDKPFVELAKMGFSYAYFSPGVHKLSVEYPSAGKTSLVSEFLIKEGQVVFKRFYENGVITQITTLPKELAVDEIRNYRYIVPLNDQF